MSTINKTVSQQKRVSISGTITPIEWNEDGEPIVFGIYTPTEEDIILVGEKYRSRLKKHLNKNVQATGILYTDSYGDKFLQLTKLKRVKRKSYKIAGASKNDDEFISGLPVWLDYNYSEKIAI